MTNEGRIFAIPIIHFSYRAGLPRSVKCITGRFDCEMSGRIATSRAICFFLAAEIISPENS